MKIDVTQTLRQFSGETIYVKSGTLDEVGLCKECQEKVDAFFRPLTLRLACTRSLVAITEQSMKLTAQKKFERAQLASKIYDDDTVSLTVEEIAKVKECIGQAEGPLVLIRAWELLDPPDNEEDDE